MLTNILISKAKQRGNKSYRLSDGRGLSLEITPAGNKRWRFRYFFGSKEKMISLGLYPEVSLKDARSRAEDCRRQLANGVNPSQARKEQQAESKNTFRLVALDWLERYSGKWSERHAHNLRVRLEQGMFPHIGDMPIAEVTPPLILAAVRKIEARGALELAHRTLQITSQVFRYGIATGVAERDPAQDLRGALPPVVRKHRPSITDPKELTHLLRAMDEYQGNFIVLSALRFLPLVFVRPGELRHAEWGEFEWEDAQWRIPPEKMKMKEQHIVPLSRQAIDILEGLRPLTGEGKYLFPSVRTNERPMSENTLNAALRRLGYTKDEVCAHGFRTTASTLLNEQGWNRDAIERQLAHGERDSIRAAYNFAEYLPERRKMMQAWADYLDALREGAKVIPFRAGM